MINDFKVYNESIEYAISQNNYFENLKNKSLLITGANGLIASCVIDILNWLNINENYNTKIIGLVRNKNNILERFKQYKNFEILEQDVTEKILYNNKVDYIIHAASNANPILYSTDPVGTMNGNFIGMKNILEYAVLNNCKRVEYISSGEVYGQGTDDIEEFFEYYNGKYNFTNPRSCYPISKIASETLCASYSSQYNIETVIARPCHCFGPTQSDKDNRASAQFIRKALNNEDIVLKSLGTQVRSYCYVIDCAIAVLAILLKGKKSEAYNISNKNSIVSIREMAEVISNKVNRKVVFEIPDEVEKKGYNPVTKSVLNSDKLEKLGWIPCWNFEEAIYNTLEIMKK